MWGVEQTYCTPYLLSLGLTKSKTSLVWIAGPLSGLIVQPIVGTIADRSTSRWGRRRPIILTGAIITALLLLLLGFTEDIMGFFVEDKKSAQHMTVYAAVLAIVSTFDGLFSSMLELSFQVCSAESVQHPTYRSWTAFRVLCDLLLTTIANPR